MEHLRSMEYRFVWIKKNNDKEKGFHKLESIHISMKYILLNVFEFFYGWV